MESHMEQDLKWGRIPNEVEQFGKNTTTSAVVPQAHFVLCAVPSNLIHTPTSAEHQVHRRPDVPQTLCRTSCRTLRSRSRPNLCRKLSSLPHWCTSNHVSYLVLYSQVSFVSQPVQNSKFAALLMSYKMLLREPSPTIRTYYPTS